jgi:chromosome condensin MukBEF complex kleisin-like MukF subunit
MARTDLLDLELTQLRIKAQRVVGEKEPWLVSKLDADRILRLTGEVLALRSREAEVRHVHGLEGEY